MQLPSGPLIAIGATLVISLWMLSGLNEHEAEATKAPVAIKDGAFTVQVERYHASEITPELVIHGETTPSRQVSITSEVSGKVIRLHAREGEAVHAGQLIAEIDPQDKPQQLKQAKALLKQRRMEYKANKALIGKGLQNETRLAESESLLASAHAQIKTLQIQLDATNVKAPFDGILENRHIELGSYLRTGDPIIDVLDYNPFLIKGFVAEKDLALLKTGVTAKGITLDGIEHLGKIRYISSQSSKASRTFAVELEILNPDERQADGVTADIHIPLKPTKAIYISPALLGLNEKGILGAKHVIDSQVHFSPVELIKAEANGVWISGLPNPVDLITVGQSFVSSGEKVKPVTHSTSEFEEEVSRSVSENSAETN